MEYVTSYCSAHNMNQVSGAERRSYNGERGGAIMEQSGGAIREQRGGAIGAQSHCIC